MPREFAHSRPISAPGNRAMDGQAGQIREEPGIGLTCYLSYHKGTGWSRVWVFLVIDLGTWPGRGGVVLWFGHCGEVCTEAGEGERALRPFPVAWARL